MMFEFLHLKDGSVRNVECKNELFKSEQAWLVVLVISSLPGRLEAGSGASVRGEGVGLHSRVCYSLVLHVP